MIRFSIVGVVPSSNDPVRVARAVQTATNALRARLEAVCRFDTARLTKHEEDAALALVWGPDPELPSLQFYFDEVSPTNGGSDARHPGRYGNGSEGAS